MSDALLKIDDAMDLDMQTPIDVDEESDGGERKDQTPAFETLGQVQPTPLQSWLIKIPAELEARWKEMTEAGIPLGKLRHYPPSPGHPDRVFVLVVPEDPASTTASTSTSTGPSQAASGSKPEVKPNGTASSAQTGTLEYELSDSKESQKLARQKFLYMEDRRRYEFNGTSKRKGHPRLVQAVSKQCSLLPRQSIAKQGTQLRQLYAIPEMQRKKTRMLLNEKLTAGQRNSLATGNSLMQDKRKHGLKTSLAMPTGKSVSTRPQKERSYRMAKQNLIDTLFEDFANYKYWSVKALTDRHRQPEAWLKICLGEIAEADSDGPYKGLFRLKPQFATGHGEAGREAAPVEQEMTEDARRALTALGTEGDDDDDEQPKAENETADDAELRELEGDEDDDMEEVHV